MMDCARLHELFEAYVGCELDSHLQRECDSHLAECEECASVAAILKSETFGSGDDDVIVDPVVASTSGSVCSSVQLWLAGDTESDSPRDHWVSAHVQCCIECQRVATVLTETHVVLPRLAEVDPGANFTADVLMATLGEPSLWAVSLTRCRDWWTRIAQRPAFAQELSFVCTTLLVLLTAMPWSPFPGIPQHALVAVQSVGILPADFTGARVEEFWASTAVAAWTGRWWDQEVETRTSRVGDEIGRLREHVALAGAGLLLVDLDQVQRGIQQVGCDLERMWMGMREPELVPRVDCG